MDCGAHPLNTPRDEGFPTMSNLITSRCKRQYSGAQCVLFNLNLKGDRSGGGC